MAYIDNRRREALSPTSGGGTGESLGYTQDGRAKANVTVLGPEKPKTKTGYTEWGAPIDVPESQELTRWQPNTGYAGSFTFDAPPSPKPRSEPSNAGGGSAQSPYESYTPAGGFNVGGSTYPTIPANLAVQSPYQSHGTSYQGSAPSVSQPAYEDQAMLALQQQGASSMLDQRARLSDTTFNKRMAAIQGLGGPGGASGSPVSGMAFDEAGARAAAFARAKDQQGQISRSSIDALKNLMAETGGLGSGLEAGSMGQIVGGAAGNLGDMTREQYIQDLNRAAQVSDREAQAGLTRRGQDLSAHNALLALINNGPIY